MQGNDEFIDVERIRNDSNNSWSDIHRKHYMIATDHLIANPSREGLRASASALTILEMELGDDIEEQDQEEIMALRKKLDNLNIYSVDGKERYKNLLIRRIRICLNAMTKRGEMPAKEVDIDG